MIVSDVVAVCCQILCVLKLENIVTVVYNGHERKEFTN